MIITQFVLSDCLRDIHIFEQFGCYHEQHREAPPSLASSSSLGRRETLSSLVLLGTAGDALVTTLELHCSRGEARVRSFPNLGELGTVIFGQKFLLSSGVLVRTIVLTCTGYRCSRMQSKSCPGLGDCIREQRNLPIC